MIKLTKLLPANAAPAQTILKNAKKLMLDSDQRAAMPKSLETEYGAVEVAVQEMRPLEVNDVFVDETGAFWVVRPAVETVLHVTGDPDLLQQAAIALMHRGARVAIAEDGFLAPPIRNLPDMLEMAGLHVEFEKRPFDPIRPEKPKADESGCCCGHHHHHDGESCGCGHHHDHEGHECCCGGHHHHEGEACGCGHHHDHEDHECCGCGHHHDHEDHECCCGGHRRENDGKSGCGQA